MSLLMVLVWASSSLAAQPESLGSITCYSLKRPVSLLVQAEIFGHKVASGLKTEFVDITLTRYNWNTQKESAPLKVWKQVPSQNDRNFSEHFVNSEVEFEAYYDDVGAMSSITYQGRPVQLACEIDFNQ